MSVMFALSSLANAVTSMAVVLAGIGVVWKSENSNAKWLLLHDVRNSIF